MSKTEYEHHEKLLDDIYKEMKIIFESSEQPVFIYLDDNHWVPNKKFLSLLGYKSFEEIAALKKPFLDTLVDEKSQETLATTYERATTKMVGSTISVVWKKKSGEKVDSTMILVPIAYHGHIFALNFISLKP
jgi:carbohydrate-binding DOMON domain-containing protein